VRGFEAVHMYVDMERANLVRQYCILGLKDLGSGLS
jgi:hypothetical protein